MLNTSTVVDIFILGFLISVVLLQISVLSVCRIVLSKTGVFLIEISSANM